VPAFDPPPDAPSHEDASRAELAAYYGVTWRTIRRWGIGALHEDGYAMVGGVAEHEHVRRMTSGRVMGAPVIAMLVSGAQARVRSTEPLWP